MIETPFLYEDYAISKKALQQLYPGIVVSPAPASSIKYPTIPRVEELGFLYPEVLRIDELKYQVSPAPASEIHEPTHRGVEEI